MNKRARILVDCDGILGNFVDPTLDLIHQHTGDRHSRDEITQWDVFASVGKKEHEHILDSAVRAGGFALNMPVLPGAKEALARLEELGDVFIVTSNYGAPNWVDERDQWFAKNFNFSRKKIINASAKFAVQGEALIDDSDSNLKLWSEQWYNKHGIPLLFDSPWNRHVEHPGVHRVSDWDSLIDKLESHLKSLKF